MVTLELSAAARWVYVKASGFLDYWDDSSDLMDVVNETKQRGLDAILYDARNVSGELSRWKVASNLYMLRQQLDGVRLAYVMSDTFVVPFNYSQQVAKSLGVPTRAFWSLIEASRWLEENIDDRVVATC